MTRPVPRPLGTSPVRHPRTIMQLTQTEQVLVSMIRRVASGQSMGTLVGVALEHFCPKLAEGIARNVFAVARALDDAAGPDVALQPLHCRRVTADEITMLRMIAAVRAVDVDSARSFAGCLVGPARVPTVLAHAGALAAKLSADFRVDPVAPRPAWDAA